MQIDLDDRPTLPSAPSAPAVFYDVAMRRLDEQIQRIDGLDTKTAQLFGLSSAVLPIFGGLVAFRDDINWYTSVLFISAAMSYGGLVAATLKAYQVREFSFRPRPDLLAERCQSCDEPTAQAWVAQQAMKSIIQNERHLSVKAFYVWLSTICFAIVSMFLTVAAILGFLL